VKNRDGCTPLGPWLVDKADVPEPDESAPADHGERQAHAGRQHPRHDLRHAGLIEYLSGFMTLNPGDLILTGTPEGVVGLQVRRRVVTEIEGIGALINDSSELRSCASTI
jgi:5-oxopent-3-ene-1,2,5-tricarboxylate decarboxylase/2-hydroxyhepta-2,4-diene-1,7-dioate isomerase